MRLLRGFLLSSATVALMPVTNAIAQDEATDEIVVTGIRGSLQQSLDVKRGSEQVVDAISAEDVGKFPDTNLAEALQRITGVAIDRSGGEGQFITVRGLGPEFNAVTLNGRTLATDNPGREFSFDVLSSDVLQRAEVYKTSTPNLQSGGIGALVNIVTARPLETGTSFSANAAGLYDTLRDEFSPQFSGVGSWRNDDATIGFLLGASYSNRRAQEDSSFTNGFALRTGDTTIAAPESSAGLTMADLGELPDGARVQQQVVHRRDVQDRERLTINATGQISDGDRFTFTLDGLYTSFDVDSFATEFSGFFSPPFIDPQLDENGTVISFSRPGEDFLARNPDLAGVTGPSQNDNVINAPNDRDAETFAIGGNFDWDLTSAFNAELDIAYSRATRESVNPFVVLGALAPASPLIESVSNDGISTITNIVGATDTSIQRLHFVNVTRTEVEDEIFEAKFNGTWTIDRGFLQDISFGGFFTDREKGQDQFDNFSPTQGAGIFCAYCGYTVDFDDSILSEFSFDGFLDGVDGANTVPAATLTSSFEAAFAALNDPANIADPNRTGRSTIGDDELLARQAAAGNSIFGFFEPDFNPAASFAVDETVYATYFNTQWGGDFDGELPWSANLGFRVAITETTSTGVDQPVIEFRESVGDTQLSPIFGPATTVSIDNRYVNFLPSFNLKVEPTENTVVRLAYSETVTRPTLTELGVANSFGGRSNAPTSTGGNPFLEAFESTNYDVSFEYYFGDTGFFGIQGFHKEFDNFIESQTLPVPGVVVIPAGNAGNTTGADLPINVDFQDTRDRNGETGSITGVELAFQMAFESLPAPWDGFGTQLNYTYVTSEIDRQEGTPVADCDYNGLSPHSFNATGFYEKGPLQARLSYNYRDEFLFQCFSNFSEPRQREAFGQLDFSTAFDINDNFQVYAEGINITGSDTRDFSRFSNRFLTYSRTGSRYLVGVRAKF
ncbi:MAG: TonB-dependent receptor [Pseudomonadota bacterium]